MIIPNGSLVVLVGASGSGKSTFAKANFQPFEIVSADYCRGLISNDENNQKINTQAFELLNHIVSLRLDAGLLTVVDATNVTKFARKNLLDIAKAHHALTVAIILDVPLSVCIARHEKRTDRNFGPEVVRRHCKELRQSLNYIKKENFTYVYTVTNVENVQIERVPLHCDKQSLTGPFDIIGDVHGCLSELQSLLLKLEYQQNAEGIFIHQNRTAVFLGDLVDRGPNSVGVLELVQKMSEVGSAMVILGNHENKLTRFLRGRKVTASHGLESTIAQLATKSTTYKENLLSWLESLPSHLVLDGGKLVVAHAGLKEVYHNKTSYVVRDFALYGQSTGETDSYGMPIRYQWAQDYRGQAAVVYGHTTVVVPEWINNTICIDTGCVFGGSITALRWPEKELVQVSALQKWYGEQSPLDNFVAVDDVLNITDVLGKRSINTSLGKVVVSQESAAGALEVMSRWAVDPAWLVYLPPTMSPTKTSVRSDFLEHPTEAFTYYQERGVSKVICQEKHMGSRSVLVLCKDEQSAKQYFGTTSLGMLYTRTGRPFFGAELTEELVNKARVAFTKANLWEELGASWVGLDCELLPWSSKSEELLKRQYGACSAAGLSSIPKVLQSLQKANSAGVNTGSLVHEMKVKLDDLSKFTSTYENYCWETNGLQGLHLAPFQVLATNKETFETKDHLWHLSVIDKLVEVDPDFFKATKWFLVDTSEDTSKDSGVAYWEELTKAGGEGMVVKPLDNLVFDTRIVQPGVKVRGREYLRLIYGPEYTENISTLKERNIKTKQNLAIREYMLGLEALRRKVNDEPLYKVHEAVFGVLALESEPVDIRL